MKVLLYGAGEVGERTMHQLQSNNHKIIAFLDRKKEGYIYDVPIYTIEKYKEEMKEDDTIPVIICLSNGALHKDVADDLYKNGFQVIFFCPIGYALSNKEKVRLNEIYNQALKGRLNEILPYEYYQRFNFSETGIIKDDGEQVVAWVGQEILFSEDIFTWTGDLSKIHCINDGVDVNLNIYHWYQELFEYFDGKNDNCKSYLDIFHLEENSLPARKKLLDREKLYHEFERQLRTGLECFIESSTEVIWNEKNYFNLVGGHHRTMFLQHKGYAFYPVRMKKDVYEYWKNEGVLNQFIEFIREHEIEETYVPIPNPYFMDFPSKRENSGKGVLYAVLQYLGPIRLEGRVVTDISQYQGYFARMAKRMCADKVVFSSFEKEQILMARMIAELVHLEDISFEIISSSLIEVIHRSDIIFAMENIWPLLKSKTLQDYTGLLFIEMATETKQDILDEIREQTKLKNYQSLYKEVVDGIMMEMGVCS